MNADRFKNLRIQNLMPRVRCIKVSFVGYCCKKEVLVV